MPVDKKFDVILMNPPFNEKKGEGFKRTSLWKKFANKALDHANEVILIAPLSAKAYNKHILVDNIKFDGQDNPAVVVVWNREAKIDNSKYPKFDVVIKEASANKVDPVLIDATLVEEFDSGEMRYVRASRAKGLAHEGEAAYIRFNTGKANFVRFSTSLLVGGPYQITGPDTKKCVEWLNTEEGRAAIETIACGKKEGRFSVLISDRNSKAFNINRVIGRLRDEP